MPKAAKPPPVKTPKRPTPDALVPRRIMTPTVDDELEVMTRAVFQAGLSWAIIEARWPAFRAAFSLFDAAAVADYGDFDIERLMATDDVIHSRKKIEGTIANARTLLALTTESGGIAAYIARFESYAQILADVRQRFAFVGDLSCYYWLFRTGRRVPLFEDWIATQSTDHPRMREMVVAGRSAETSTETPGY